MQGRTLTIELNTSHKSVVSKDYIHESYGVVQGVQVVQALILLNTLNNLPKDCHVILEKCRSTL